MPSLTEALFAAYEPRLTGLMTKVQLCHESNEVFGVLVWMAASLRRLSSLAILPICYTEIDQPTAAIE